MSSTPKPITESGGAYDPSDLVRKFKADPIRGARALLRLKQKDSVRRILAHHEFMPALKSLSVKATDSPTAALCFSRFALQLQFFEATVAASASAGFRSWPEPSKFESKHRRIVAEALGRLRPRWALDWLAKAVLGALRYATLRRFFESCLVQVADDDAQLKRELAQLRRDGEGMDQRTLLAKGVLAVAAALDMAPASKPRAGHLDRQGEAEVVPSDPARTDQSKLIAESAWSDADKALGRALQDMGLLTRSFEKLESSINGDATDPVNRARGASDLVMQWVRQAARQRNLKALSEAGERVSFDPVYHVLEEASLGDLVRVVKPPIVRGSGSQQVVVVRGEVELD
jgi:hypothetical protein